MAKISIDLSTGSLEKSQTVIGIDLGTTNSLIATIGEDKKPYCLGIGNKTTVPSVIHLRNGIPTVGQDAIDRMIEEPQNTIYSVKRLIGKTYEDVSTSLNHFNYQIIDEEDRLVRVAADGRYYTPIELSSLVLKTLKTEAERKLNQEVRKVVITVPAYFDDNQRQATRDAGKLAGLDVLRIINEPTAASLAYGIGLDQSDSKTVAVYDLGGGTFDISILNIQNGIYEVLSTNGDTFLGGDDFDNAIVNHWIDKYNLDLENLSSKQMIRLEAENAKICMSEGDEYLNTVVLDDTSYNLSLAKVEFEELVQPIVNKTVISCMSAMKDAGLTVQEIDEVVLVGGSTKSPYVKGQVSSLFSASKINDSINPDEIVALGAALEADILAGNRSDLLLLDVTPLSLGIETMGGLMDVIIPRNNKIPCTFKKEYTTSVDGQINLKVTIFQGERELVQHNRSLASFILKDIPAMPAGMPKIEVTFMLNADGILNVSAEELRSKTKQAIEIQSQSGLADEDIQRMLKDSITHAAEDMDARSLAEAVTEANQMIYSIDGFVQKHKDIVSNENTQTMSKMVVELKNSIKAQDKDLIIANTEKLNEYTKPLAEQVMNSSISKALKGKNIQ